MCDDESGQPIGVQVVQAYDNQHERPTLRYDRPLADILTDNLFVDQLARMKRSELETMFNGLSSNEPAFDLVVDALAKQEQQEDLEWDE